MDKKVEEMSRKAKKTQDKLLKFEYEVLLKIQDYLRNMTEIRNINWKNDEIEILNKLLLLTSKPMVYLLNLSKNDYL